MNQFKFLTKKSILKSIFTDIEINNIHSYCQDITDHTNGIETDMLKYCGENGFIIGLICKKFGDGRMIGFTFLYMRTVNDYKFNIEVRIDDYTGNFIVESVLPLNISDYEGDKIAVDEELI